MADCCLIKKVATVEVYENKNEVRAYGFMAGDRNTPVMEVRFKHLWGESNLSSCKLRWIIVDDVGSLLVGEVPIQSDNTALINLPNELFTGDRRMKVQLTVASCDGERILNLQQFTDLKVINSLAPNEVVEPVYQILINAIYDESQKYLKELETSYTQKYGSLDSLYKSARASLEQYLITAENGGNAEFLQGYSPAHFQKVENTISDLIASTKYKVGDVVQVLGYYSAGDGAGHPRQKKPVGYSGADAVIGADGSIWACLAIEENGYIDIRWFGAKSDFSFDTKTGTDISDILKKCIAISNDRLSTPIKIIGNYYVATPIETEGQLYLVGNSVPCRNLIKNDTSYSQKYKPTSSIYVKSGITAITLLGTGGVDVSEARDTHINIEKVSLISDSRTSTFCKCLTFGAPSRPGYAKTIEATGFDTVFEFNFKEGAGVYGTNYYNFQIDDGCNFYENNNSIKTLGRDTTSPSLGGLSMANSVFEQGARIELKNLFGYNEVKNCLLEGQDNPIISTLNGGVLAIVGNYFEANSGKLKVSSSGNPPVVVLDKNYCHSSQTMVLDFTNLNLRGNDLKLFKSLNNTFLNVVFESDEDISNTYIKNGLSDSYANIFKKCRLSDVNISGKGTIFRNNWLSSDYELLDNGIKLYRTAKSGVQLSGNRYETKAIETSDYFIITFYKTQGALTIKLLSQGAIGGLGFETTNIPHSEGVVSIVCRANRVSSEYGISITSDNESKQVNISDVMVEVLPESYLNLVSDQLVKLPTPATVQQLDTPYHAAQMASLGILDSYHNYLSELHQYEKSQNVPEGVMNLNVVQPPVIPKEIEEYAKEYNLL